MEGLGGGITGPDFHLNRISVETTLKRVHGQTDLLEAYNLGYVTKTIKLILGTGMDTSLVGPEVCAIWG